MYKKMAVLILKERQKPFAFSLFSIQILQSENKKETKMEHTCPDCDVWSVAMAIHPIIFHTTS